MPCCHEPRPRHHRPADPLQYLHDIGLVRAYRFQIEDRTLRDAVHHPAQLGIALFEYCFQVPANRIGSSQLGGPFSIWELKVIQEVISLLVFTVFAVVFMKSDTLRWNHLAGFVCLILAVYFIFRK